ncbi:Cobinamide kinase / cobinamide phosphate guanyltransferase [compost metagenome]
MVVDCLTLWLTALMMGSAQQGGPGFAGHLPMPTEGEGSHPPAILADAIATCAGPLVLLGHARGGPLLPGRDARQFADTLGRLDQQAAAACERVTLMSGGLAMVLKEAA